MANQPKKYKKFVATAATATLVASVIVPVASAAEADKKFTDIGGYNADVQEAIYALAEAGIINGTSDTTFTPGKSITKGQVVKMLGKWVEGQEGFEEVTDWKTEQRFDDVALDGDQELLKYAAIASDYGVFEGNNGKLNASGLISRQNMALVLDRAYEALTGTSLVEIAAKVEDKKVADLATAKTEAQPAIQALRDLEITTVENFNPTGNVTRANFASFLYRAINVDVPANDVKIESVKATNAKTIEVKFNTAAEAVAADFAVNKGTVKVNIASVAISEDKKTATIEMTSKLTEGEYTVTVAQKDADALKASLKVENEKVSKLEIASTVAPVTSPTVATINAKVLNQYGEDITKLNHSDVTVTVSGAATAGVLNNEGVLTLTLAPLAKEGESIFITLVHAKTGVSTQATVKVSKTAAVSEVAFGKLYNKDGKTLNQDTDFSKDKFYVPVTAKDQYGKEVTDVVKLNNELVITNTNPAVATVNTTVKTVKIDNKDVNVVEVTNTNLAGSTNLIAVSKTTGANTSTTLNVEAGVKVSSLSVNSPLELVTAGKDVLFPLTIIDTAGKELKTKKEYDALNAKDPINLSAGASVVEVKDKGLFVKVAGTSVIKDQAVTVVISSTTGKVSTQTVIAKEAAKPTVITGLSSKKATSLRVGDTTGVNIANTDLVVEDQYGQVITDKAVLSTITFAVTADPTTVFNIATVTADKEYKITAVSPVTNSEVKSSKLSFKILDGATPVESSTFTKTFTVVEDSQFASYEVADVKTIYAAAGSGPNEGKFLVDAGYNQDIVVKAKTSAGEVVELKEGVDFTVTGQPADGEEVKFAKDAKEAKVTVTITINRTGEQLTKELTYSNVAPKVADFIFTSTTSLDADKAEALEDLIAVTGSFTIADLHTNKAKIVTTDQYGKKSFVVAADTLTIVPSDASKVTVTNNGTATASVTSTVSTIVTAKVKIGDVTKEVKVTVAP
ncbi:MAG: S-layer homology domain-containing protein [Lysinibacillus sp.]